MTAQIVNETGDANTSASLTLLGLNSNVLLDILMFLRNDELYKLLQTNEEIFALCVDETVWKQKCFAKYGDRLARDYIPPDRLWRAEYCHRNEVIRREQTYMRELSQGRAGKRQAPPTRITGPRFCAIEGNASRNAAILAKQLYDLHLSEPAARLHGMAGEIHSNIEAASRIPVAVERRQGTAPWSLFRAAEGSE